MVAAGNSNHLSRKVQAVSGGATRRRGSREIAWPTRDIEHMLTGRNFSGFQQRPNVGRCRMSKAVYVARSSALPAGVLEGADRFGLKAHRSAHGSKTRRRRQLSKSIGGRRATCSPMILLRGERQNRLRSGSGQRALLALFGSAVMSNLS